MAAGITPVTLFREMCVAGERLIRRCNENVVVKPQKDHTVQAGNRVAVFEIHHLSVVAEIAPPTFQHLIGRSGLPGSRVGQK